MFDMPSSNEPLITAIKPKNKVEILYIWDVVTLRPTNENLKKLACISKIYWHISFSWP